MAYSKWKNVDVNGSGDTNRAPADWRPINGTHLPIITSSDGGHNFNLNNENLEKLLLHPNICERKVVVISCAGEVKKGKSFILNYFLRYLVSKGSSDWLCSDSAPMTGFPWKGGRDITTVGIYFWSEPYLREMENGEQVAIILMDTQGVYDYWYKIRPQAMKIFGLSSLISSVQIFNTSSDIKENDFEMLKTLVEYGRMCIEGNTSKPFQMLHFLIKDWIFPYHYAYGLTGGDVLLDKRLQVQASQTDEMQQVRCHIRSCYDRITCFLMPHPGLSATVSPHFDGRISDIDNEYKSQLKILIPEMLSPKNLYLKEIHGTKITGRSLIEYIRSYWKIYKGPRLPDADAILKATSEANNMSAISVAKSAYMKEISQVIGDGSTYISPDDFNKEHNRCKTYALRLYGSMSKMGCSSFCQPFMMLLRRELDKLGTQVSKHNDTQLVFPQSRTFIVLIIGLILLVCISRLFSVMGANVIGILMSIVSCVALGVLVVWSVSKYTGQYNTFTLKLDKCANIAAYTVIDPIMTVVMSIIKHRNNVRSKDKCI